jgi:hypothetical protein
VVSRLNFYRSLIVEAGNLSLRKLTQTESNDFHNLLMCGYILVTVREALAAAPGLKAVRVAMVRRTPPNAYGVQSVECLLAAAFTRDALQGIQWQTADAAMIVNDASTELRIQQGPAEEIRPLDLSNEPSLAATADRLPTRPDATRRGPAPATAAAGCPPAVAKASNAPSGRRAQVLELTLRICR